MKQSCGSFLIVYLGLQSFTFAGDQAYIPAPAVPDYETCSLITVDNGLGGTYQKQDSACMSRNAEKQRNYQAAVEAYNRSLRMVQDGGSSASSSTSNQMTLQKPVEPQYEDCKSVETNLGNYSYDYACMSRNQAKKRDYDIQMMGWNKYQQEQAQANQADMSEQQRLAAERMKAESASEALRKAQEENARSAANSKKGAGQAMGVSVAFAAAFAASCAGVATCNYGFLASSIAFGLMSGQSSKQAGQNTQSQMAACKAQAQLSSSGVDCSGISTGSTTPTLSSSALVPNTFDSNGKCVTDKATCDKITSNLPAGMNIKDVIDKSNSFATNPPYTINPDGTVTTKNGKTFKAGDFKDRQSLMAAGLTAEQADATLAAINKSGLKPSGQFDNVAADLKGKDAKGLSKTNFGGVAISGSGGSDSSAAAGLVESAGGALGSKAIGGSGKDGKRNPAAAGLTRDFNGESIGAAGDDIFTMMNRRYKVKTAQDAFISN